MEPRETAAPGVLEDDTVTLLASGAEGINGVQLANAMLLSAWTDSWVDLPIDDDLYYAKAAADALPAECPYRLADLLRHDWHPPSRHGLTP